jgi:hypothetical protein
MRNIRIQFTRIDHWRPTLRSAAKGVIRWQALDRRLAKSFSYNEAKEELTIRGNGSSNDRGHQSEN